MPHLHKNLRPNSNNFVCCSSYRGTSRLLVSAEPGTRSKFVVEKETLKLMQRYATNSYIWTMHPRLAIWRLFHAVSVTCSRWCLTLIHKIILACTLSAPCARLVMWNKMRLQNSLVSDCYSTPWLDLLTYTRFKADWCLNHVPLIMHLANAKGVNGAVFLYRTHLAPFMIWSR